MTDQEYVEAAAERWGLRKPSPDEVLMARWPLYNEDRDHTLGYHEMMERAYELATEVRLCRGCGKEILEGNTNKLYCHPRCIYEPVTEPQNKPPPKPKPSAAVKRRVEELFASMIDDD